MDFPNGPAGKAAAFAAATVSPDAGTGPRSPARRYACETNPNASVCGVYGSPESVTIYTGLRNGSLALHFNRKPGDLDHTLPLSRTVGLWNTEAVGAYGSRSSTTAQRAVDRSKALGKP